MDEVNTTREKYINIMTWIIYFGIPIGAIIATAFYGGDTNNTAAKNAMIALWVIFGLLTYRIWIFMISGIVYLFTSFL